MKLLSLMLLILLSCSACGSKTKESLYNEGLKQLKASNPGGAVVYFKNALEKDGNFTDARFQLGKAYAALGKSEQAEKEFKKVLSQNPSQDEVQVELASLYNKTGKVDEGFKLAQQYVSAHPASVDGLEVLGVSCALKKNFADSERYLLLALKGDPQRVATKLELSSLYEVTNRVDRARGVLTELIAQEPKNFKALYALAEVEKNSGNIDAAVAQYRKILQIDGNQTQAQYRLALVQVNRGELDKADVTADELIKKSPKGADGHRLKGLVAFYKKNYTEAIASLQTSVKLGPTLEGYYFLGLCYYNKGELETALSEFRTILDRVPTARRARLMTGQILLAQKRNEDAIAEIKKVIAQDETDAVAHDLLGAAYLAQGLYEDGMQELTRATKLDPKMVSAHLKKGYFYFSKGRSQEAETELATAVQAAPDQLNSRLLLSSYYQRQGKTDKALALLQKGLSGAKADAPILNAIAAINLSAGNKAEAVKNLESAKRLDPAATASYQNLAALFAASGEYPKAIAEYGSLLQKYPKSVKAMLGLAALSEISGKESDALSYYQKATETKAPEAFVALAQYHQRKGATAKAVTVLDEAIKLVPSSIPMLELKGRVLMAGKEYRQALKIFDEVEGLDQERGITLKVAAYVAMRDLHKAVEQAGRLIAKHPSSPQGYLELAAVYQSQKDLKSAANEAQKAIRVDPKSVEARLLEGNIYEAEGEYAKSAAAYQEAQKLKPDSVQAQFAQAALLDRLGKKKEAAVSYRSLLAKNDRFVPALNNLAYLCADGYGSKEDALRFAITAYKLEPGNAGVSDTVGYALIKNGRGKEAVQVLERAATMMPNNQSVSYHLALAYKQAGEKVKSQQTVQKALSYGEGPDAKPARALLAELKK